MDYSTTAPTQASWMTPEEWITHLNKGNTYLLQQYLNLPETCKLDLPKFRIGDAPLGSLWNFLQVYEHPLLLKRQLPVEGLVMFLTALRHNTSDESWAKILQATSVFVQKMVKRKFQRKKKVYGRNRSEQCTICWCGYTNAVTQWSVCRTVTSRPIQTLQRSR